MDKKSIDKLTSFEIPFFQVDNNIFDLEINLNIYQKIIYIFLARCSNQKEVAFPSYQTIAQKCGCSKRKAIDTVAELIEFGLIIKKIRPNSKKNKKNLTNLYKLKPVSAHCLSCIEDNEKNEGSAHHALGGSAHHALGSAHGAPKKELLKNNLEEDEETFSPAINLFIASNPNNSISQQQIKDIKKLVDKFSVDFVMKAIKVTSDKARNFNMDYIKKVLKSYEKNGYTKIEDIENAEKIENMKKEKIEANRKKNIDKLQKTAPKKKDKNNFNNFVQRDCPFVCKECDKTEDVVCNDCEFYKKCDHCEVGSCS